MLKTIRDAAGKHREADLAAGAELRARLSELVSPQTGAAIAAVVLRRALAEGLAADLSIGFGGGVLGAELAMEVTLAEARVTPETLAEIERSRPSLPPLLVPFGGKVEAGLEWLIADLGRRLKALEAAPKLFKGLEVRGMFELDVQVAGFFVEVIASSGEG